MVYTQTQWKSGDVITSEKLNKIEGGIADGDAVTVLCEVSIDSNGQTFTLKIGARDLYELCRTHAVNVDFGEEQIEYGTLDDPTPHLTGVLQDFGAIFYWARRADVYMFAVYDNPTHCVNFVAYSPDAYPVDDAHAINPYELETE